MNTAQLLAEIQETNLIYLLLAKNLLRSNRESALSQLGISGKTADALLD